MHNNVNYQVFSSYNIKHKYNNIMLYGAEYETSGSSKPSGLGNLYQKDVPCSVCRRKGKSSVLMIPGKRYSTDITSGLICITC
jgi:hypothetical protein